MDLIAILIALWLTRLAATDADWRVMNLFREYADALSRRIGEGESWNTPFTVLALMVPPVLVVGLLQLLLADRIAGLLYLALSVVVLVLCLPATRADQLLGRAARAWQRDDGDSVRAVITELDPRVQLPTDAAELPRQVALVGLRRNCDLLFGLLFWFVLLGPFGAVAWRMACLAGAFGGRDDADDSRPGLLATWYHWLGWVPARLTVLSYAAMGNFSNTMTAWRESSATHDDNGALLEHGGAAALDLNFLGERGEVTEQLREARRFLRRTALLWLAAIALLTIFLGA
ncbi:MAG: regulatory signaling modulator protein AmpE [Aquisalimonadaceae bacterium]